MRTVIAEDAQGQVLVIVYRDGRVEVARRARREHPWGPPLQVVFDEARAIAEQDAR